MRFLLSIVKWLWQLPQNVLALIIEGVLCSYAVRGKKIEGKTVIYAFVLPAGMSLGNYIFLPSVVTSQRIINHELGHCRQSMLLGPLYLIVVGLPSLVHNIIHSICHKHGIVWDYYSFYTEKWMM